ncbi:MAG TPA: aldolase [Methanothermococcus okinawensis]|uniref:fructose-bisphosphate aldolase n=1 Tax=Methanofervidicoccus abyssi TaxID=2082189 RepID=A0A401HNJ5_9EURY|nr:aldolase [Methanofervidicoccus abyssi]GBF35826.1 fructose-bisphosphate aldolase/6-deoxy-5-ketofructose 1-phosphate synthase [Methanofervidicoccus abyssi]HIP16014.1 aldolase [Methanothermococcus okinawensis]HIP34921.1 aldolase [Methanothermococcus okinawensis]
MENSIKISEKDVLVPLDVPPDKRNTYIKNYLKLTQNTGRLMLFAGDQKIEHLNDDFYGPGIPKDDADPEHLFRIASNGKIGAFATQLGLIARYGMDYRDINYVVKINSKTNLVKTSQRDPISRALVTVKDVVEFKNYSKLNILGVGYTVYLGSEYEHEMLSEASRVVYEAHRHGLIAILWMYPRGKAVKDEYDPHLIAGAAGVALCLGADFVKVNYPKCENPAEALKEAVLAAGRTKVVCAGGKSKDPKVFLQELYDQIHISGAAGNATGRNIHQKSFEEAVRMCNAIYAITIENKSVEEALEIYYGK